MSRIIEFVREHLHIIAVIAAAVLVLAAVFAIEGHKNDSEPSSSTTELRSTKKTKGTAKPTKTPKETEAPEGTQTPSETKLPAGTQKPETSKPQNGDTKTASNEAAIEYSEEHGMEIDPETGRDRYNTEPVPEGMPLPEEPQEIELGDTIYTCTLSVSCSTILSNITRLDSEKAELVPADGWIFEPQSVSFTEGESVFDVLQRTMRERGIHMEFVNAPIYNSAYIEGINNLYEYDCGSESGWMYRVNGWFPNYGCSRYALHNGDVVEWVYTCDNGRDVGGYFSN